jgi:tryptophanyl-tRNA synthetase
MKQHIELQERHPGECFYFIADYHALTTLQNADELRASVRELAVSYLAVGLDPEKALLFRQSDVPEVTELAWLLATVTGMGLLERATSYKDKVARGIAASVGLFTYPVLMAADILIYDATLVPVGKDQIQHVEMTQDMATHFNQTYGKGEDLLRRPEFKLSEAPYVTGTDGQKMSTSYGNTLPLFESGKKLKKLVGAIVTDSTPLGTPLDPDKCNVFSLLKLFAAPDELERIRGYYRAGKRDGEDFGYGHAKMLLAEHIEKHFAPARARRDELLAHPERVDEVLRRSGERARVHARATLERCKRACGLI